MRLRSWFIHISVSLFATYSPQLLPFAHIYRTRSRSSWITVSTTLIDKWASIYRLQLRMCTLSNWRQNRFSMQVVKLQNFWKLIKSSITELDRVWPHRGCPDDTVEFRNKSMGVSSIKCQPLNRFSKVYLHFTQQLDYLLTFKKPVDYAFCCRVTKCQSIVNNCKWSFLRENIRNKWCLFRAW